MSVKAVLFDLDGTLLPMDQEIFARSYVGGLAGAALPHGYEPKSMARAIMAGTDAMVKNDGVKTNEDCFWEEMAHCLGRDAKADVHIFNAFYATDFQKIQEVCGYNDRAAETVKKIKAMGFRVALATNPLFPKVATDSRIRWAGFDPADFEFYTTYETSRHCKPNPDYYRDVVDAMKLSPEECLMVGNDADEDMIAEQIGMRVFLLTDCLINKSGRDLGGYPQGDFNALLAYVEKIQTMN
ncbi:MAG: HAD family hydrolase [Clostridia bacterium]|nr:HAD family hydrolase [Clostridia bacterium]